MNKRKLIRAALPGFAVLAVFSLDAGAQLETTRDQSRVEERMQRQERIYGSQLMTEQERKEHREKMRQATSKEQREQIRAEHHERMKGRANAQGITLPDEPPARDMGQGRRLGQGMGSGQGRGPGVRKGGGASRR